MKSRQIAQFRKTVWAYWKKEGRHNLPWRKTRNPYRILVSEVMLQQTQVPRVIENYEEFLRAFPTARALSKASLADVLKIWSGLGYNRRAKYLHDAAKAIVERHAGRVPRNYGSIRKLQGVGDYTAHAMRVFAFNEPDILIETNIRTALIHRFFPDIPIIRDREILEYAQMAAEGQDPRTWNWALMDYGAHLKHSGVRNNHQSAHYAKQSKFEGSLRQVRGAILRALHAGHQTNSHIYSLIRARLRVSHRQATREQANKRIVSEALASLARDGLIAQQKGKWRIA